MSVGISGTGRRELTSVLAAAGPFVETRHVVDALDVDGQAATQRLARWARQGWLRRVRRGLYIPVPVDARNPATWSDDAMAVATEVWAPCYFTGWTAANHWGLSEQVFRTVVLKTSQRVRASEVRLLDQDYLIAHAPDSSLTYGLDTVWRERQRILVADPARTVLDVLDAPRLGGGIRNVVEILSSYRDDHPVQRVIEYGDRLGNRTVFKRLGYLLETSGRPDDAALTACRARISTGVSLLDPDAADAGHRVMRWGLRVNVPVGPVDPT